MGSEPRFVGIDVSKARLDVAVRPARKSWVLPNDETGIAGLVPQLVDLGPALVLLEATGGLEVPLVAALASAELPVVVVNPRQVRDFAKATGTLAKTDALDAGVLAHFADVVRPDVRPLKDAETEVLNSLTARRHQVMTMLVAEKNRLGSADRRRWSPHRGPHRVVGAGVERPGPGAASDFASEPGVAREGRPAAHGSRSRRAAVPHPAGQSAGAGHAESPGDRRLGGRGSLQPRQRRSTGQTRCLGRTLPGAGRALYGSLGGQPPQPCYPGLLPEATGSRQAEEIGAGRLHAQAAGNTQLHAQTQLPLVRHDSAESRSFLLTFKTVAKRCSFFGVGFPIKNHYPRFKGAPFHAISRPPTPTPSVDSGLSYEWRSPRALTESQA